MVVLCCNCCIFIVQVSTGDGVKLNIDEPKRKPLDHQQKQKVMFKKNEYYHKVKLNLIS